MANSATLDTTKAAVRYRLLDKQPPTMLSDPELESAIKSALSKFSTDVSVTLVSDLPGNGTSYYRMSDIAPGWVDGNTSSIIQIEYPALTVSGANAAQTFLTGNQWAIQTFPSGSNQIPYLVLPTLQPTTEETIRVTITTKQTLIGLNDATATTFSDQNSEAFYDLCTAVSLEAYAAKFSRLQQSTIQADNVKTDSMVQDILKIADRYYASYQNAFGLSMDGGPAAADSFITWDSRSNWGGSWLFHSRW